MQPEPNVPGAGISRRANQDLALWGSFHLDDPDGFRAFWTECRQAFEEPPDELSVALRRYSMIFDQEREHDRILDYGIILEALFLENQGELVYRLRLATAHFVGATVSERRYIAALVGDAYKIRSKIAHGRAPGAGARKIEADMDKLIRRVLRLYCERVARERRSGTKGAIAKLIRAELEEAALGAENRVTENG